MAMYNFGSGPEKGKGGYIFLLVCLFTGNLLYFDGNVTYDFAVHSAQAHVLSITTSRRYYGAR